MERTLIILLLRQAKEILIPSTIQQAANQTYIYLILFLWLSYFLLPHITHPGPTWWTFLAFHFSHANIVHLILNSWALILFRPRLKTLALAYPLASLAALLCPLLPLYDQLFTTGTCGASAIICAAYARRYASWHLSTWPFIRIQIICAILSLVVCLLRCFQSDFTGAVLNWPIHIISFYLAYFTWALINRSRK